MPMDSNICVVVSDTRVKSLGSATDSNVNIEMPPSSTGVVLGSAGVVLE